MLLRGVSVSVAGTAQVGRATATGRSRLSPARREYDGDGCEGSDGSAPVRSLISSPTHARPIWPWSQDRAARSVIVRGGKKQSIWLGAGKGGLRIGAMVFGNMRPDVCAAVEADPAAHVVVASVAVMLP